MSADEFLQPVTLRGTLVTLSPLSHDHHEGLTAAARDGRLWELGYTVVPDPDGMKPEIARRLGLQAKGAMLPFTVLRNDTGTVIGMTTFMDPDPDSRRLEIGSTWLARSAQRTGMNTESKLLLLSHAFEQLRCIAVEFRTHWLNLQSREASAAWARSRTACCATTGVCRTAPFETPSCSRSSRRNGRRCAAHCSTGSRFLIVVDPCREGMTHEDVASPSRRRYDQRGASTQGVVSGIGHAHRR